MRVLHFYKTYYPDSHGGVEKAINQIVVSAANFGIESEVLSLSKKPVNRTVKVNNHLSHRVKTNFTIASTDFSLTAILRFRKMVKNFDIIHYHFPWPFMDLVHFLSFVRKPTVLTYHSDIVRQKNLLMLYRPLKNLFLKSVDKIVATSPNYFATSKVLEKYKNKVTVIPIGLDKKSYPIPSNERMKYWKRVIGQNFFVFVGVLRYYKGLHILMEAAQNSAWPVVVIGAGPVENALREQARELGLLNVKFLGGVSEEDKVAILKLSYALVFPSHLRSEAFGISLLEGAMFGKPLISSEIGTGTSYININNVTGLVVSPSDSHSLRSAMNYLWSNPKIAKEMGLSAQKRYKELFSANSMGESYARIYKELLNNN